jgi:hypothetical protein
MEQQDCFIRYIEQSIIRNWNLNALTDYNEQNVALPRVIKWLSVEETAHPGVLHF